jgi:hypothetical protein
MSSGRVRMLRMIAAFVVVAVACPVTLFGGAIAGCAGGGFNGGCATSASFLAPLFLMAVGVVSSILVRGWRGYLLTVVAVVVGMIAIFVLSAMEGTVLPFDLITGTLWTLFFLAPVTLGWVFGAVGAWLLLGARGGAAGGTADGAPPSAAAGPPAG